MACVCIPCPQPTRVVAAVWHQCSVSKPSVCWQLFASSVSQSPSDDCPRMASSWLEEWGAPRGAPWGSLPRGVPFICCFADVGFGSCLTCINCSVTAWSLWQNQLWSSCPESAWRPGWSRGSVPTRCSAALTISTSPVPTWRGFPWQRRSKYGTSTCSRGLHVYPGTRELEGAASSGLSAPISKARSPRTSPASLPAGGTSSRVAVALVKQWRVRSDPAPARDSVAIGNF